MNFGDPRLPDHFWSKAMPEPNSGCWLWLGATTTNGYGTFSAGGTKTAHRYAYSVLVGPVDDGLVIDHKCRVKCCANPAHMEPVTQKVNVQRGVAAIPKKTHCKQGHPLDEQNTQIRADRGKHRECRACKRIAQARLRERRRVQNNPRQQKPRTVRRGEQHHAVTVADADVALARKLKVDGWTGARIARLLGVAKSTVFRWLHGRVRKHSTEAD